ncbi:hypothetical protein AB833_30935 [Chromatiales bacterium (ex Bugula neritina AB1)]|nr:hypothetical protein AB833_30935 [Chromatiales bacterium (ex Bugula neritina AB1)]
MHKRDVHVDAYSPQPPARVWAVVQNFCEAWHPAIDSMVAEIDNNNHLIRAFTVHGEQTIYRERLTWYSDSERTMFYTHVEGIRGVDCYKGQLRVSEASDGGSDIIMKATFTAATPRADEIATGTRAIFKDAVKAIAQLAEDSTNRAIESATSNNQPQIQTRIINSEPALALSYTGAADATLCLFLHGIGGNRSNWDQQLAALAPHCQAAALDLRGYGNSHRGNTQSAVDDYCNDILRVAGEFNADKLMLCGLSYGAWIATSFALRYPERLEALVLSGGCTGMSEADTQERESFLHSREQPLSEGKTPADFADNVVSVISGPNASASVRARLLASMQAIPTATYADALRCFTRPQEKFDFSRLTMPTLLLTGEHDKLAPPQEIRQVAQRIHAASAEPDVRYECLADAGHVCNLEAPELYNNALVELVKRIGKNQSHGHSPGQPA